MITKDWTYDEINPHVSQFSEGTLCSVQSTSGKEMKGTIDREKSKIYYIKCFEYKTVCVKMYERRRTLFFPLILLKVLHRHNVE